MLRSWCLSGEKKLQGYLQHDLSVIKRSIKMMKSMTLQFFEEDFSIFFFKSSNKKEKSFYWCTFFLVRYSSTKGLWGPTVPTARRYMHPCLPGEGCLSVRAGCAVGSPVHHHPGPGKTARTQPGGAAFWSKWRYVVHVLPVPSCVLLLPPSQSPGIYKGA